MPKPDQHRLTIRLTGDEYALIQKKAGEQALAAFVRDAVLDKAAKKRKATRRIVPQDRAILAQVLAKLGTSPLILAFRAIATDSSNGVVSLPDDEHLHLTAIADDISEIKHLLMTALGVRKP